MKVNHKNIFFGYREVILKKLKNRKAIAFCGLGNNENFLHSLEKLKIEVLEFIPFPDHHNYSYSDIKKIITKAKKQKLSIICTRKDFIKILKDSLNMEVLILGEDTLIGNDRKGYKNGLIEILGDYGSRLIPISNKKDNQNKISSSQIKKSISDGDIVKVNQLLGRNFFISGKVIEGKRIGSTLGYPTANIQYDNNLIIPKDGIYKTETFVNGSAYLSATSIGNNPTFDGAEKTIETFIIDFNEDIYNYNIKVSFLKFIRDQKKFDDIQSLKKHMSDDIKYIVSEKG